MKNREIVEQLTTEQKLTLAASVKALAEGDFSAVGIPAFRYSGPHRMNARCGNVLPSFAALANSWNVPLVSDAASVLAAQAREEHIHFLFTPAVNVSGSPYRRGISEDACLAEAYARAIAKADAANCVMPCLSGCGLNEEDARRLDKTPDPRVLHEYYLAPFSSFFEGKTPSVSASYAAFGGEYGEINCSAINARLHRSSAGRYVICTDADAKHQVACLKKENLLWAGDVAVLRAAHERYLHLKDEVDKGGCSVEELEEACRTGEALEDSVLDEAVDRVIEFASQCARTAGGTYAAPPDPDVCARAAEESIVLLKNTQKTLPLKPCRLAVIGRIPTPSGTSSEAAYAEQVRADGAFTLVGTAAGYDMASDRSDEMAEEACTLAAQSDAVVLFLGADAGREEDMIANRKVRLPANQLALASALFGIGKPVIVVLSGELMTDLSFDGGAAAVLLAPVSGTACAAALHAVLTGRTAPSGRLAFTCYDDPDGLYAAAVADKDAGKNKVGGFLGYRNYDTSGVSVRYPFGFGLSYTSFAYSACEVNGTNVSFTVRNTGRVAASEVAQVYAGMPRSACLRPKKVLCGFAKIRLAPGQEKRVTVPVSQRALAVFENGDLRVESGEYAVYVGSNVSDIRLRAKMRLSGSILPKHGEAASDYLQAKSNILADGYTFSDIRVNPKKGKRLFAWGLVLAIVGLLCATAALACELAGILGDALDDTGRQIVFFVPVGLLLLGIVLLCCGIGARRKARRRATVLVRKKPSEQPAVAQQPYARLFDEAFAEEDAPVSDGAQPQENKTSYGNDFNSADTMPHVCERFCAFAAARGVGVDAGTARRLFASMCASRLLILRSKAPARLKALMQVLAEFCGTPFYLDACGKYASAEEMFYRITQGGAVEKTAAARAVFDAAPRPERIFLSVLDGVIPDMVPSFFLPLARYINFPDDGNSVILREDGPSEGVVRIPRNVWFVMLLEGGADLRRTDAYFARIASFLDVEPTETTEAAAKQDVEPFLYGQLAGLERVARDAYALDEESGWKKIDRLERYVCKFTGFSSDNKGWTRMEKFSSVYLSGGGEQADALDATVAAQLMLPILASPAAEDVGEEYDPGAALDLCFGEGNMPVCKQMTAEPVLAEE